MKNTHDITDDVMYYKAVRLVSTGIVVRVDEKTPWSDGAIEIFHSPSRFKEGHRTIRLKDRQDLKDYITMLQDFDERFGEQLDEIKYLEKEKKTKPEGLNEWSDNRNSL